MVWNNSILFTIFFNIIRNICLGSINICFKCVATAVNFCHRIKLIFVQKPVLNSPINRFHNSSVLRINHILNHLAISLNLGQIPQRIIRINCLTIWSNHLLKIAISTIFKMHVAIVIQPVLSIISVCGINDLCKFFVSEPVAVWIICIAWNFCAIFVYIFKVAWRIIFVFIFWSDAVYSFGFGQNSAEFITLCDLFAEELWIIVACCIFIKLSVFAVCCIVCCYTSKGGALQCAGSTFSFYLEISDWCDHAVSIVFIWYWFAVDIHLSHHKVIVICER